MKNVLLSSILCLAISGPLLPAPGAALNSLFGSVWTVTKAPSPPAHGAIYIFLPNGTLFTTSCLETYRVSTWTEDPQSPGALRIVEDGQFVSTLQVDQLTSKTLRITETLTRSKTKRSLTLNAIEKEFVCPDLPK